MTALFTLIPEAVGTIRADSKAGILAELADRFARLYELDRAVVLERIEERERLARDLGDKPLMMLRNHGMLAVGESVSHTFMNAYYFQRSCEIQVAALSCNTPLREVPNDIGEASAQGFHRFSRARPCYDWDAMVRKIDAIDPSYRE